MLLTSDIALILFPRQLEESRAHVKRLEYALRDERGSSTSSNTIPPPLHGFDSSWSTSVEAFRWHLQYCNPDTVKGNGLSEIFNFEDLARQIELSQSPSAQSDYIPSPRWPSLSMIHESIESFSRNKLYSVFPIVDIEALRALANTTVLDQGGGPEDAANKACLVAFTAFISRIRQGDPNHEPAFKDAAPDAYMQTAMSLVPQMMIAHTNVRALEAILLLVSQCEQRNSNTSDILRHTISHHLASHRRQSSYFRWHLELLSPWEDIPTVVLSRPRLMTS